MSSHVEAAQPADAPTLQRLLTTVFTENFIGYTIYQSPQSASFIARLIQDPQKNYIRVLREGPNVIAFSQSSLQDGSAHLGFIGVSPEHEGKGLGNVLLQDLIEFTRSSGREALTLDVFEDNMRPYRWYLGKGFAEIDRYLLARIRLSPFVGTENLDVDPNELEQALEDEAAQGFGNVTGSLGHGVIALGLIGGRRLRLRDAAGLSLREALPAIAGTFATQRESLITSGKEFGLPESSFESRDVTLRLRLPL